MKRGVNMPTISIAKGKGYARHNDRSIQNKSLEERSWNPELSDRNIVYKNESVKQEYEKVFGQALDEYNQKQIDKGRPDRQIKNYYEKISRSKQEKTSYELIVQIGSIEDKNWLDYDKIQLALDEYNRSFQKRNPNFHVFQQITHRDEEGMDHTHIMFFPVSTGNKRGLETKNSLSGALSEMGYGRNGFDLWREKEVQKLSEIMLSHDLEVKFGNGRSEHLNVKQYREYKKYESLTLKKQNTLSELEKSVSERKVEIDGLETQKNEISAQIARKTAQIEDLESRKEVLQKNPTRKISDNPLIQQEIQNFIDTYKEQKQADKAEFANDYGTSYDDAAIAMPLTDSDVTIKKTFLGDQIVTMPYSTWERIKENHNNLVDKFKKLRNMFYHGVEKLMSLFQSAKNEPEYFNVSRQAKEVESLSNRILELQAKVQTLEDSNISTSNQLFELIQKNRNDEINLEIFDIMSLKMGQMTLRDEYGEEVNLLDSILDKSELTFEAKDIIKNRVIKHQQKVLEQNDHGWEIEL